MQKPKFLPLSILLMILSSCSWIQKISQPTYPENVTGDWVSQRYGAAPPSPLYFTMKVIQNDSGRIFGTGYLISGTDSTLCKVNGNAAHKQVVVNWNIAGINKSVIVYNASLDKDNANLTGTFHLVYFFLDIISPSDFKMFHSAQ